MKRQWLAIIAILLVGCFKKESTTGQAHLVNWYGSIEQARSLALQTNRPMLLSFEVSWCPWCKALRESVYACPEVVDSLMGFVCVMIDGESQDSLVAEYGVSIFPTIVITDCYGNELTRLIGLYPSQTLIRRIAKAKTNTDILSEMYMLEEVHDQDPVFQLTFGKLLAELGIYDAALLRFEKAAQLSKAAGTGIFEEATFSIAEAFMLKEDYKQAAHQFRQFAISFPSDQRAETALILSARCYEQAGDLKAAAQVYRDYLTKYPTGNYVLYASNKTKVWEDKLNRIRK